MSVWDLFERQILRQTKTTNQTGAFFTELDLNQNRRGSKYDKLPGSNTQTGLPAERKAQQHSRHSSLS